MNPTQMFRVEKIIQELQSTFDLPANFFISCSSKWDLYFTLVPLLPRLMLQIAATLVHTPSQTPIITGYSHAVYHLPSTNTITHIRIASTSIVNAHDLSTTSRPAIR
jgi:hypothetical protein